jgi:hypothetical protein
LTSPIQNVEHPLLCNAHFNLGFVLVGLTNFYIYMWRACLLI